MLEFSTDQLLSWLSGLLWPFFRISSMLLTMPAIGYAGVSTRVRAALGVTLTWMVAPVLPDMPSIELFSVAGFFVSFQQIVIGVLIGLAATMFVQAFVVAGQMLGMQTSLGFASMVDPNAGQSPVLGQFYLYLVTLMFLAVDGHLLMIRMIIDSFSAIPVGAPISELSYQAFAQWFSVMFANALALAIAPITALLCVNFAFGFAGRVAPQLNVFTLGFAITMLVGLSILWLTIGVILEHFDSQWRDAVGLMCTILDGVCKQSPNG